jgi:hemolysin III
MHPTAVSPPNTRMRSRGGRKAAGARSRSPAKRSSVADKGAATPERIRLQEKKAAGASTTKTSAAQGRGLWSQREELNYYCRGRLKPSLRGHMHRAAAVTFPLWAGYQLSLCQTTQALASALISLIGTISMLAASACYHTVRWKSTAQEDWMAKVDYVGIFMQVAFSLAPFYTLLLPAEVGWTVLGLLLLAVFGGALLTFFEPQWLGRHALTWVYIVMAGSQLVPLSTRLFSHRSILEQMTPLETTLLVIMGVCYVSGSQAYAFQRPKLWEKTFGFHELWHLLVVIASACTYACNCSIISRV